MSFDRAEISKRFGGMIRKAREDKGISQQGMASLLGLSRKTIQNWENGESLPSFDRSMEWFHVLGLQPMPYYLRFLYPEVFENLEDESSIDLALDRIIKSLPDSTKRKILYILSGSHGSSAIALTDLIVAYLHTPLGNRISVAQIITTMYMLLKSSGNLVCENDIMPDESTLNKAIAESIAAFVAGQDEYTIN